MTFSYSQLSQAVQDFTENYETSFVNNMPLFVRGAEDRIFTLVDLELFRKNATSQLTIGNPYLSVPTDYMSPFSLQITTPNYKEFLLLKDVNYLQEFNNTVTGNATPRFYGIFDVDNFILSPTPDVAYNVELHYYYRPESITNIPVVITLNNLTGTFVVGESITGNISGASATLAVVGATQVEYTPTTLSGTFSVGETVTGGTSGATGVVVAVVSNAATSWLGENAPNALLYGSLVEAYTYMKGEQDMMALYEQRFIQEMTRLKDLAEARENSDAYRRGLPDKPRS